MKSLETLEIIHDHHLSYLGNEAQLDILGALPMDVSRLFVSIHVISHNIPKQRIHLDLYDYASIQKTCLNLSETQGYNFSKLEKDFLTLTDLLESYREKRYLEDYNAEQQFNIKDISLSLNQEKQTVHFLSQPDLLARTQSKLRQIGIVGEKENTLLLYLIGLSYKTENPLHVLLQSTSGAGKSHLINTIGNCFPPEDVLSFSRITSKSLYHYRKDTLKNKLILIQDYDGLDEEALYALRELQSFGRLTSSSTGKDVFGNHVARLNTVEGHFSSFGAATQPLYLDNMSRMITLSIDESYTQSERIMRFVSPNNQAINTAQTVLSNVVRLLRNKPVKNPFEAQLVLPSKIHAARRASEQLKSFIKLITFFHQYQRKTDENGYLLTTKEDLKIGIELFFNALKIKTDELEPYLRSFFEKLTTYLTEKKQKNFTQREIRNALGISRSALARYIKDLLALEFIHIQKGNAHKGYTYSITEMEITNDSKESLKNLLLNTVSQQYPITLWDAKTLSNTTNRP